MGAGKTTVGCLLSDLLCMQFADTDLFIEEKLGMPVAEIFHKKGNSFFRKTEKKVLQQLCEYQNIVIATGGGTPCNIANMELIKHCGTSFYIQWNDEALLKRLLLDGVEKRPLLAEKNDLQLTDYIHRELENRKIFYEQADYTVSGKNDEIIAKKIKGLLYQAL